MGCGLGLPGVQAADALQYMVCGWSRIEAWSREHPEARAAALSLLQYSYTRGLHSAVLEHHGVRHPKASYLLEPHMQLSKMVNVSHVPCSKVRIPGTSHGSGPQACEAHVDLVELLQNGWEGHAGRAHAWARVACYVVVHRADIARHARSVLLLLGLDVGVRIGCRARASAAASSRAVITPCLIAYVVM